MDRTHLYLLTLIHSHTNNMFTRAELKILSEGRRIKAIANSLALDETTDFDLVNAPISMVVYTETLFTSENFQLNVDGEGRPLPYLDGQGDPEMIKKIRLSFNGTSYEVTAAEVGKGVDLDGNITWFTNDDSENGKPETVKLINWLDSNL